MDRLRLLITLFACIFAACGGGGDSGSSQTTGPSLSTSAVNLSATTGGPDPATQTVVLSAPNLPVGFYYDYDWQGTAVRGVSMQWSPDNTTANISFSLWPPGQLGAGTYTDSVTVKLCTDSQCAQQVAGSPKVIQVLYVVSGARDPDTYVEFLPVEPFTYSLFSTGIAPIPNVTMRINRVPPAGLYFYYGEQTAQLITSVTFNQSSWIGDSTLIGSFALQLKSPSLLASGFHTDSVNVRLCFDPTCTRVVGGSSTTPEVKVRIFATEGRDYERRELAASIAELEWSAATQKLYLITHGTSTIAPLSLVEVDPVTNTITRQVGLAGNPSQLVLSTDSQFAYVVERQGVIERFRISDLGLDLTIPVSADNGSGPRIEAVPGQPNSLLLFETDNSGTSVTTLDNATPRPVVFKQDSTAFFGMSVVWEPSGSNFYGIQGFREKLSYFNLDASGVALQTGPADQSFGCASGRYHRHQDNVYSSSGKVYSLTAHALQMPFDINTNSLSGTMSSICAFGVVVDPATDRTFFAVRMTNSYLQSYSTSTRQELETALMPTGGVFNDLVRWGPNGLAFIFTNKLVLINGRFVAPN